MAFIKTKLSTIRPNDLYDTLRLTYGFNNEEDQKQPGILAKPAEPVSDSDVVAAGFFDYMLTKSRERAAKLRAEAMEQYARDSAEEAAKIRSILGITRSKAPTGQLSDQARDAMFSSSDIRGTELTMKDNAREAQEVFQPMITSVSRGEQPEMADSPAPVDAPSIDARSNEMLDKAKGIMSKDIEDVLETVLDSDVSDSTDSADGGAAPSDGKDFETRLEERLVELEGFEAEAYKPDEAEEYYTIGYGHYGADVKKGTILTEEEARDLLRKDIKKRMPKIKKTIKNFDALSDDLKVEIAQSWFRGGISGSPETIKLINAGEFDKAATEFLDNEEYRTTKLRGVKTRMEALSNTLKAESV